MNHHTIIIIIIIFIIIVIVNYTNAPLKFNDFRKNSFLDDITMDILYIDVNINV